MLLAPRGVGLLDSTREVDVFIGRLFAAQEDTKYAASTALLRDDVRAVVGRTTTLRGCEGVSQGEQEPPTLAVACDGTGAVATMPTTAPHDTTRGWQP